MWFRDGTGRDFDHLMTSHPSHVSEKARAQWAKTRGGVSTAGLIKEAARQAGLRRAEREALQAEMMRLLAVEEAATKMLKEERTKVTRLTNVLKSLKLTKKAKPSAGKK